VVKISLRFFFLMNFLFCRSICILQWF
jgi:hypothetical protein